MTPLPPLPRQRIRLELWQATQVAPVGLYPPLRGSLAVNGVKRDGSFATSDYLSQAGLYQMGLLKVHGGGLASPLFYYQWLKSEVKGCGGRATDPPFIHQDGTKVNPN